MVRMWHIHSWLQRPAHMGDVNCVPRSDVTQAGMQKRATHPDTKCSTQVKASMFLRGNGLYPSSSPVDDGQNILVPLFWREKGRDQVHVHVGETLGRNWNSCRGAAGCLVTLPCWQVWQSQYHCQDHKPSHTRRNVRKSTSVWHEYRDVPLRVVPGIHSASPAQKSRNTL